jgi:hypothetical protein
MTVVAILIGMMYESHVSPRDTNPLDINLTGG